MLDKKYCTVSILFAANVADGGRTIDEVPTPFKADVQALLKTDKLSSEPTLPAASTDSGNGFAKNDSQEVAK
ncbi:hypothetical protein K9P40_05035 [Lentilactobacillus otakiensis]|uniref:hypothetical protein n=1 Tax=Lentilactobacillus otakiensis TaxID=481720 RepID=UPI001CBF0775|nr:hypothetical protein [Lentilactobacillus otakiensis]MBZ3776439.1 hypothetical protein [Lentilactobacillus otakiensis]